MGRTGERWEEFRRAQKGGEGSGGGGKGKRGVL